MSPAFDGFGDLLGDPSAIAMQRAVAELRAGRPVMLEWPGASILAAAADTMAPQLFTAFKSMEGAALALTAQRAASIGMEAAGCVLLPLAGLDHGWAEALAAAPNVGVHGIVGKGGTAQAEAALEMCKRAHLLPAALVAPVLPATAPPGILRVGGADLAAAVGRPDPGLAIVSSASVPLATVPARFVVFRSPASPRDQVAVIVGDPNPDEAVPVRLHSACLTGDLFGSLRCDCGDQLRQAIEALGGGGVLLYLDQEGRGTGLRNKMRAYALQDGGLDTIDADRLLGYGPDERSYAIAAGMLRQLGFSRVRLLTNNPQKLASLAQAGIKIEGHLPLRAPVTAENRRYLKAKAERGGHMLGDVFAPPEPSGTRA